MERSSPERTRLLEAAWGPRFTCHRFLGEHAPGFNNGYPPLTTGTCWGFAMAHLRLAALARFDPSLPSPRQREEDRDILRACLHERRVTTFPGVASIRALSLDPSWRPLLESEVNALWARRFFHPRNLRVVRVNSPGGNVAALEQVAARLDAGERPLVQLQAGVMHQHVTIAWRLDRLVNGFRLFMVDSNHHESAHGPSVFLELDAQGRARAPTGTDPHAAPSGFARVPGLGIRLAPRSDDEAHAVVRALEHGAGLVT